MRTITGAERRRLLYYAVVQGVLRHSTLCTTATVHFVLRPQYILYYGHSTPCTTATVHFVLRPQYTLYYAAIHLVLRHSTPCTTPQYTLYYAVIHRALRLNVPCTPARTGVRSKVGSDRQSMLTKERRSLSLSKRPVVANSGAFDRLRHRSLMPQAPLSHATGHRSNASAYFVDHRSKVNAVALRTGAA
jgi:hypothetical protein